ncbi:MAG: hypothetical protein V7607_235 [Solirubrobacteraceae bacterium]
MFDRFRKSDRARREERQAVEEQHVTAVADRDEADPTTVHERDDASATTVHARDDAATTTTLRDRDPAPATTTLRGGDDAPPTTIRDREDRLAPSERFARDDVREPRTLAPVVGDETLVAMHDRQRIRFGGISWGSAFFGLLSAIGLAAVLLGIVAAAGVAIGVAEIKDVTKGNADTIGLGGAILVLAVLALSWLCGGYVAGRMARFDGPRQGLAVWVWTVVIGAALAIAAVIGGSDYDVFAKLNLPNVAVGDQTLTTGGAITLAAACVVTLVFAVLGGKLGDRFHRRVDRFAAREYVEAP